MRGSEWVVRRFLCEQSRKIEWATLKSKSAKSGSERKQVALIHNILIEKFKSRLSVTIIKWTKYSTKSHHSVCQPWWWRWHPCFRERACLVKLAAAHAHTAQSFMKMISILFYIVRIRRGVFFRVHIFIDFFLSLSAFFVFVSAIFSITFYLTGTFFISLNAAASSERSFQTVVFIEQQQQQQKYSREWKKQQEKTTFWVAFHNRTLFFPFQISFGYSFHNDPVRFKLIAWSVSLSFPFFPHSFSFFCTLQSLCFRKHITLSSTSSLIQLMNVEECLVSCFRNVDPFSVELSCHEGNSRARERKRKGKKMKETRRKMEEDKQQRIYLIAIIIWDEIRNVKRTEQKVWKCETEGTKRNEINIHFIFPDNKKCSHRYPNSKLIFFLSSLLLLLVLFCFVKDAWRLKRVCGHETSKLGNALQNHFRIVATQRTHYIGVYLLIEN